MTLKELREEFQKNTFIDLNDTGISEFDKVITELLESLVPEEKDFIIHGLFEDGYNQCRAEILAKIQEIIK